MRRLPAAGAGALIVALATVLFQSFPANAAAPSCTDWKSTVVPPPSINVLRTALGRVDTVPFRRYVEVVLAGEWGPTNPREALAAGAVAVKQYGWYFTLAGHWRGGRYGGTCYDVRDTNVDQVYRPATKLPTAKHVRAVNESWPVTLRKYNAKHPTGRFFPTSYNGGAAYDTCGSGVTGWKLWQRGATDCARKGYRFERILRIYYGPHLQVVTVGRHDVSSGGSRDRATLALLDTNASVAADLTGDGREDLAVLVDARGGQQIRVFPGTTSGFGAAEVWWDSAVQGPSPPAGGFRLVTADWDADGRADLGLFGHAPGPLGPVRLYQLRSTGKLFEAPVAAWEGAVDMSDAQAYGGDFNGDGRGDLAIVEDRGRDGIALVVVPSIPTGGGLGPSSDWYVERTVVFGDGVPLTADVNGDGRDDIVFFAPSGASGVTVYLYRATDASFSRRTLLSAASGFAWAGARVGAADLDRDGLDDLVVVYDGDLTADGDAHAWLSRGTSLVDARWGGEATLD